MLDQNLTTAEAYRACIVDVHESQSIFRTLLRALSSPGEIHRLPPHLVARSRPGLVPLMALLSHNTPFAVSGDQSEVLARGLTRATFGLATSLADAAYAALLAGDLPDLADIRCGSDLRPDSACQVSMAVDGALHPSTPSDATIAITGPGVPGERFVRIAAEHPELLRVRTVLGARRERPPIGFDVWLVDATGAVVGIPRTSVLTFCFTSAEIPRGN